ncbi:MAG: GYF domain-containing protein, partial [Myxococcota bacterium]
MKIVCDSCGAKYSIADEKVAGKVFKIRCKKCSSTIVVRGDQVPNFEDDGATRVYDDGSEAIWHVVVDGDQQGPMAPAGIGALLGDGRIDWDAYVWREGFEGWKPAREVPELVEAVTAAGQPGPGSGEA